MQQEATPTYPQLRARSGVLVVDGYGIAIKVHRGKLAISDGVGRERRERSLPRSAREIRRIVLIGHTGYVTLEAIRWMADVGIGLSHMDMNGRLLLVSASPSRDDALLRRAQAFSSVGDSGLEVARHLIDIKIRGEARVIRRLGTDLDLTPFADGLQEAATLGEIRVVEAAAAHAYWRHLAGTPLRFEVGASSHIQNHWMSLGARSSGLGSGARMATTPGHALLNYCYALAEIESSLALSTLGLDRGIGVLHSTGKGRHAMALDLLEAIRPDIDGYVLGMIGSTTFRLNDFHETRQGNCRILPPLTHLLAETMTLWRRVLGPVAEDLARRFARSASLSSPPTPLTESRRSRGRRPGSDEPSFENLPADGIDPIRTNRSPLRRCQLCGADLERTSRRSLCDVCLPRFEELRLERLKAAGRARLSAMRSSPDDPAHTADARAKRSVASKQRMSEIRAWESINGKSHDWDKYLKRVRPIIASMTVPELVRVTGLSTHYCWQVRAGKKRLHPMRWETIQDFAAKRGRA